MVVILWILCGATVENPSSSAGGGSSSSPLEAKVSFIAWKFPTDLELRCLSRWQTVRFWNRTGTVELNRRKSNSLWTVGTVNRWNRVQNRTGGTGTVLPSPKKLIGKVVIAFWVQWKSLSDKAHRSHSYKYYSTGWPSDDHRMTIGWPSDDHRMTIGWPSDDHRMKRDTLVMEIATVASTTLTWPHSVARANGLCPKMSWQTEVAAGWTIALEQKQKLSSYGAMELKGVSGKPSQCCSLFTSIRQSMPELWPSLPGPPCECACARSLDAWIANGRHPSHDFSLSWDQAGGVPNRPLSNWVQASPSFFLIDI